jgi:hypothetical protein
MISWTYDPESGATVIGAVYFPPPLNRILVVTFLVDTGASHSCLSVDDLPLMDPDFITRLATRPTDQAFRGIGGVIFPRMTEAAISLAHDDGALSAFELDLALMVDPSYAGLPSILGRDILFHGRLEFDPDSRSVFFYPPTS